ncbi:MAG: hypothetical protein WC405_04195 [Syntrophales bacterium]
MSNLGKKMELVIVLTASMILWSGVAVAQHGHNHGAAPAATSENQDMSHNMSMADRPVQTATVGGMKVTLDVMDMGMHVHMQGMKGNPVPDTYDSKQSQAIMVMINAVASKEIVKDATVTVTIVSPTGKKKTDKAPWYGDHYGASFSPSAQGTYKIIVHVDGHEGKGETTFNYKYKK